MQVEFKEKTYEHYFSYELARLTNITFSPDLCDEQHLGFDGAFWLPPSFRKPLHYRRRSRWRRLHGLRIAEFAHLNEAIGEHMPSFKFNLFVQYKRPEYLKRSDSKEWSCWRRKYFRYDTTPHQHDLLNRIDRQSHGRAATIYASPAFWQSDMLFEYARADTVIENSNIASVARLNGHSRFSYVAAGSRGKGHSDPVNLKSVPLPQVIENGMKQRTLPFTRHIKQVAKLVEEMVQTSDIGVTLFQMAKSAIFDRDRSEAIALAEGSLAQALLSIAAFSEAFGVSFYAMG